MDAFQELRLVDLVDVGLVALLLWLAIVGLRRSGATLALIGLAILAGIYLVARRFDLELTVWILRGFFAVFVVVVVVVFQDDLRRLFERIAVWGLRRRAPGPPGHTLDVLVRSVARLAADRSGALLVLPGRESLERHVDGGIPMGGELSEPLLLSIFDKGSPGHDGAAVIAGDRVLQFAVHLPLSDDRAQLGLGGTRHAAALGLAESTDVLCIAVSEERGTVSVARDGRIRTLPRPEALGDELRRFTAETKPDSARGAVLGALERWPEALLAVGCAAALWVVFVAGSSVIEVTLPAPVIVENLPAGYEVESVQPAEVGVAVQAARRELVLADPDDLSVRVDALLVQLGRRTFTVSAAQVDHPEEFRVVDVVPSRVRLSVRTVPADPGPGAADSPAAGRGE